METLNKNLPGDHAISSLVIGTESRHILILDPSGTTILKKFQLKSVPVFMAIDGTYDVEYRIVITCRNGNIYQIKVSHSYHITSLSSHHIASYHSHVSLLPIAVVVVVV